MENLTNGDLLVIFQSDEKSAKLLWTGKMKSEEANPEAFLVPYLDQVIKEVAARSLQFEMDFSNLEYMNSSTIPPLIRTLTAMSKRNITTLVVYKKNLKWQEASFKAIGTVVKSQNYKNITIRGV